MNPEILFKAKRVDNGEWVEGYLFQIWHESYILWGATNGIPNMIKVIPETVRQYIGIHDKNNNKIFNGDVVSFTRINALGYTTARIGEVKYYTELPIYYIMATTGDAWDWCECENIEVIGNIYDNVQYRIV